MLKDHISPFHKTLMIILALVLAGVVYLATIDTIAFLDNTDSEILGGIIKHKKTTPTPTITPTPVATNWKVYTNTKYGFTLTLTDAWKGYRVKNVANHGGLTDIYYINIPTTDTNTSWANAGSNNYAGYDPAIAVGVYTKAQWATIDAPMEISAKKAENNLYVFTVSQAQDHPADIIANVAIINSITTIINSFKLTTSPTTSIIPSSWRTLTNTCFKYQISYPKTGTVTNDGMGELNSCSGSVYVTYSKKSVWINGYSSTKTLNAFAESIHAANIADKQQTELKNKKVTALKSTTLGGQAGYTFTINTAYSDDGGGSLLDTGDYKVLILGGTSKKIVLVYPVVSSLVDIVNTFKLG